MKLSGWLGRAVEVFFLVVLFNCSPAQAALSPEVQKGLNWLQSQVQADGSLAGEAASLATPLQSRNETLATLKQLATVPASLADVIAADSEDNTEYLARRAIALSMAGRDAALTIASLTAQQNADGGFGGAGGHESNPLDTAWALLALRASNTSVAAGALSYLQSAQDVDGSFRTADHPDIYTSALALQALAAYSSQYTLSSNIQAAVAYLQTQQAATGVWDDSPFLSAQSYLALHDFIPQSPMATALPTFLVSKQLADGSWDGDLYVTALVLRALTLTASAPANPGLSILSGKVVDAQTGLPLSGVAAALTGGASVNLLTQADGVFEFRDLPPAEYALQLSLANYGAISATTATRAGQTQDIGVLLMSKSAGGTTGTVEGKVTDAATGQPLSGVMVSVNGTINSTTDASGLYQISNAPTGAVTLEVSMVGYATASSFGNLAGGGVLVFSPALATSDVPATTLQGTVTNAATGQPMAGVMIAVSGANTLAATTDAQGKYSLSGLAAGALTVSAIFSGYDTVTATATVYVMNTITFSPKMYTNGTTPPGGNTSGVTGVVLDAGSNTPLANVSIGASYGGITKNLQSGSDGHFSLAGISTASVDLKFTIAGYQTSTTTVTLDPLVVLDIGQVRLRKDKAIQLLPDVTVVSVARQAAVSDQQSLMLSGQVAVTIQNQGNAEATGGFKLLAFQDTDRNGKYDAGVDQALGTAMLEGLLAVTQTNVIQIPVQGILPFRDAPIHVWADSDQTLVEISETNNVKSTADSSEIKPNPALFQPKLKWAWSGSAILPSFTDVMSTPMVLPLLDTNGDGKMDQQDAPGVVFNTFAGVANNIGVLRAVSGKDGSELWTIFDSALRTAPQSSGAGADLDGDGKIDIVAVKNGGGLMAFDHSGILKWISVDRTVGSGWYWGGPSVADLDHDGKPEIIIGNAVLNPDGTTRWKGSGYSGTNSFSALSAVADINLDSNPVVLAGAQAYRGSDGATLWKNSTVGDGLVAVGNFNLDTYPEIVVVGRGRLSMLDHTGKIIWGPVTISGSGNAGAPTVADMDGDGIPEIGVANASRYTVFRADGSILWSKSVQDISSAVTSSSVFDFDGDGTAEVVYADEIKLRVYRGADGGSLFETPNSSGTAFEEPVIADVDGDSHADVLISANQWTFPSGPNIFHGLRLFGDINNAWVGTRRIWNQHTYHITNISDDGSVPRVEQNSWQVHNTYRLNARPGVSPTAVPDLTASSIRIQDFGGMQPSIFTVRIGNGGSLAVDPGIIVAFYSGKPEAGGALLGTAKTTLGLGSGEYQDIDLSYPGALTGIAELVIVVDDNGSGKNAISDFDRANNRASLPLSALPGSFSIQVATDQAGYGPNSAVAITASVTNAGSFDGDTSVRFSVETADGSINVANLSTTTVTLARTSNQYIAVSWNTGTTYLGAYRVKAELLDNQGASFDFATAAFNIGANATFAVAAKITTDKQSYLPTDTVNIADRVSNLAQNQVLDGLSAVTTAYQPDGSVLWSQTAAMAQLPPASFSDLSYGVNLAMATAGTYRAVISVKDSTGAELTQTETTFAVQSSAATGSGLKGSVTATPKEILLGDQMMLGFAVDNLGNADMLALPLTLSIVEPAGQTVLAGWTYTADILRGKTYQAAQNWPSDSARANTAYVAVLTATLGGNTLTLAQDDFGVTEQPVKLDITRQLLREGRLLALLSCKSGESDSHKSAHASSNESHSGDNNSGNSDGHNSGGENGDNPQCIADRTGFMEDSLNAQGIPHLVTSTLDDFRAAFRSGQYNLYWISGGAAKLDDSFAKEIREAVNRGDGLLLDGIHDERNKLLDEIAGVTYQGKLAPSDQPITLTGPLFTQGVVAASSGQPLKFSLGAGTPQATFPAGIKCGDCENGSEKKGAMSGGAPAIISNAYGKGYGIAMAFDFTGSLMLQPTDPAWQEIMQTALGYLTPQLPDTLTGGAYAVAGAHIANLSQAVDIEATDTLPQSAQVVSTNPQAALDTTGAQAKWNLPLAVGQNTDLTLALRAPDSSGSYTLDTAVSSVRNGQSTLYGSYPLAFTVASALAPDTTAKLVADLKALSFTSSKDRESRDKAVKSLQDALGKTAQGKTDEAIGKLLDATDKLRSITGKDTGAYRLAIDRWLQEIGLQWLLAPPSGTSH
jgi:hypothetical protein